MTSEVNAKESLFKVLFCICVVVYSSDDILYRFEWCYVTILIDLAECEEPSNTFVYWVLGAGHSYYRPPKDLLKLRLFPFIPLDSKGVAHRS